MFSWDQRLEEERLMIEVVFSSPGQSPGRVIVLPPALASASASALTKSLTLKFFM